MDPVSLTGTAVGIVSLGLTVIDATLKYYSSYKGFNDDVNRTRTALEQLRGTLNLVQPYLGDDSIRPETRQQLCRCIIACEDSQASLRKRWDKIRATEPTVDAARAQDVFSNVSKRLLYPFRESTLAKLRETVTDFHRDLDAALAILNIDATHIVRNGVQQLLLNNLSREHQDILDWLPAFDFQSQKNDLLRGVATGSGQWFLASERFLTFRRDATAPLLCVGAPGAGKTIIACIAIDRLLSSCLVPGKAAVAFIFCNHTLKDADLLERFFASLAKQLLIQLPDMPAAVQKMWHAQRDKRAAPNLQQCSELLLSVTAQFERVYIVVDALDECTTARSTRQSLMDKLGQLKSQASIHLLFTSRAIPEITEQFEQSLKLEITASKADVGLYLDLELHRMDEIVRGREELREEIVQSISDASDGIFLLARLHMDSLVEIATTPSKARKALKDLPHGPKALNTRYEEAMHRIEAQSAGRRDLAKNALLWVTHTCEDLSPTALQHALSMDDVDEDGDQSQWSESGIDPENLPALSGILSACAGLLVLRDASNVIQFAHFTADVFSTDYVEKWFGTPEDILCKRCIRYLAYSDILGIAEQLEPQRAWDMYPLCRYAAKNWGYHAGESIRKTAPVIDSFLKDDRRRICAISLMNSLPYRSIASLNDATKITPLELCAHYGLHGLIKNLWDPGSVAARKDARRAIFWAARWDYHEFVARLLRRGVLPGFLDEESLPPGMPGSHRNLLDISVAYQSTETIELLLSHQFTAQYLTPSVRTNAIKKAISISAGKIAIKIFDDTEDVKQKLLRPEVLIMAIKTETSAAKTSMLTWLFDIGMDLNLAAEEGSSLGIAARNNDEEAAKLLVSRGARIDTDDRGLEILSQACYGDCAWVVEQCLARGVPLDCGSLLPEDTIGDLTLLDIVARNGSTHIAQMLLEKGAPIKRVASGSKLEAQDKGEIISSAPDASASSGKGESTVSQRKRQPPMLGNPLNHAIVCAQYEMAKLLLQGGIDPDCSGGRDYTTVLQRACKAGWVPFVQLLLEHGADPDADPGPFGTALYIAIKWRYKDVKKVLREHGAQAIEKPVKPVKAGTHNIEH